MSPKRLSSGLPLTAPAGLQSSARAAEHSGLEQLYRQHARYVAGVAVRLLGRDGEVDDVVQDVFIEALRGAARLREPGAIKGWLATVTVRTCVRRLRRQKLLRALHLSLPPADFERLATPTATPQQRTLLASVYRALDRLPAQTRVIWILRHVLHEPLPEIVVQTGCSQSTVQRRLREAESRVEEALRHD